MKTILSFLIILFAANFSFGQNGFTEKSEAKNESINGVRQGKWLLYLDSLAQEITDAAHIKAKYYSLVVYKDGNYNETARVYTLEGKFVYDVVYVNGKGLSKIFHPSGNLQIITPYTNGLANGIFRMFDDNGKPQAVMQMSNNKGNGWYILFDQSGKIVGKYFFKDNKIIPDVPADEALFAELVKYEPDAEVVKANVPVVKTNPPVVKANVPETKTKRNADEEEDSKDIYAANIDYSKPGKYYALIIGSSNYLDKNIPDLDSLPIKDAIALKKVLSKKYLFEKENIKELYNPTRRDIVIAFGDMAKKITPNDNLLIFYAGHGHYEKENDIGYWLPTDAEVSNSSNWLYNDQLVADIKKIKSLHTLLISDACFSGSIFKTRSVNMEDASSFVKQKYQLPSRKAITSGTLKTVPNKSVFIKYLLDRLNNNSEKFFSASQLFQSLEQPVSNNSKSLPQFGVIQNVGDEGGDFIFIKR